MDLQKTGIPLRSKGSKRFCSTCKNYVWINLDDTCDQCGAYVPRSNQASSASGSGSDGGSSRMFKRPRSHNKEFSVSALVDSTWQPQTKSKKNKKKTESTAKTGGSWNPTGAGSLGQGSLHNHQPSQGYQGSTFSSNLQIQQSSPSQRYQQRQQQEIRQQQLHQQQLQQQQLQQQQLQQQQLHQQQIHQQQIHQQQLQQQQLQQYQQQLNQQRPLFLFNDTLSSTLTSVPAHGLQPPPSSYSNDDGPFDSRHMILGTLTQHPSLGNPRVFLPPRCTNHYITGHRNGWRCGSCGFFSTTYADFRK